MTRRSQMLLVVLVVVLVAGGSLLLGDLLRRGHVLGRIEITDEEGNILKTLLFSVID